MSMNNNAFVHGLAGSIEPGGMESGIVRYGNVSNKSSNNKESLTINIDFLNYHFDDDG